MARLRSAIDSDPVLSRKRTADLLKQLRRAKLELRNLKRYVATLESRDVDAHRARILVQRSSD
jgi:hypothetical protein